MSKPRHIPFLSPDPMAMWNKADSDRRDRMRVFNEIMSGPNPLTPEEVRRLMNRRPVEYAFMEAFSAPRATA
jgi:hypothetical protein